MLRFLQQETLRFGILPLLLRAVQINVTELYNTVAVPVQGFQLSPSTPSPTKMCQHLVYSTSLKDEREYQLATKRYLLIHVRKLSIHNSSKDRIETSKRRKKREKEKGSNACKGERIGDLIVDKK